MKKKTRTVLRGIGSLIDIFPRPEFSRHIPRGNAADRLNQHWEHVGDSFRRVMAGFPHEQDSRQSSSEPSN